MDTVVDIKHASLYLRRLQEASLFCGIMKLPRAPSEQGIEEGPGYLFSMNPQGFTVIGDEHNQIPIPYEYAESSVQSLFRSNVWRKPAMIEGSAYGHLRVIPIASNDPQVIVYGLAPQNALEMISRKNDIFVDYTRDAGFALDEKPGVTTQGRHPGQILGLPIWPHEQYGAVSLSAEPTPLRRALVEVNEARIALAEGSMTKDQYEIYISKDPIRYSASKSGSNEPEYLAFLKHLNDNGVPLLATQAVRTQDHHDKRWEEARRFFQSMDSQGPAP